MEQPLRSGSWLGRALLLAGCCMLVGCTAARAPEVAVSPSPDRSVVAAPSQPPRLTSPTPPRRSPKARAPRPPAEPEVTTDAVAPPPWLGTRVLPRRPDGWGVRQNTPRVLRDRRFVTRDLLPPPATKRFTSKVRRVPADVVARSTWRRACPLPLEDLRYATVSFWGFDDRPHTGEMIVNADAAEDLVSVFRRLYQARFPIEEMRVRRAGEIDAPPTGDYNNTDVFDCRPATGGSHWSQHAYGLAIDINPFHNPYLKGDLVVPEMAEAYLNREWHRPGMIQPGDVVTAAFAEIGWGWGGNWSSLKDWQHFSSNGH